MRWKRFLQFALVFTLALVTGTSRSLAASKPRAMQGPASAQAKPSSTPDLGSRLAAIEKTIDTKRTELGIPGVSLVIVKDDKVIYLRGLGLKDFERKVPVTPDTLFAIGSSTKAFTALAALISADEGKLSLNDAPKKYLPYFKLQDADADAKITIRDLLCHRSGLNRTDLAMITGTLSREELIRVAGLAKPTTKLGERFQYQNVMYAAAGEAVARAQNSTWERVVAEKIFKPLGMKASDTSITAMHKSKDFSFGYEYVSATKETRRLPQRDVSSAAPAGAINSTARDLAQWLRLLLAGGVFNGKRLVSEKSFEEFISKQMNVQGKIDYGLGWFLRDWNGHKVVEHGGNIDGFNAQVAFMPDQKLAFALLTNVSASPLGQTAMETVWSNLVEIPKTGPAEPAAPAEPEVGTYHLAQARFNIEIVVKEGKLVAIVPGQPEYPLINVGGRKYRFGDPAPSGFFMTFRPVKGRESESEMYLEQPQGNVVLQKVKAAEVAASAPAASGPYKDLAGSYENDGKTVTLEIKAEESGATIVVPGQPAYRLVEKEKDTFAASGLPDSYRLVVKRDPTGNVGSIVLKQPNGDFAFSKVPAREQLPGADELMAKVIAAGGGETNLRRHTSVVSTLAVDFENQGVTAESVVSAKAPASFSQDLTLWALGKKIGWVHDYFDGTRGASETSFSDPEKLAGKPLEDARIHADFYELPNWKTVFKTVSVMRSAKVGDEDVHVVVMTPEKGNPVTAYVSKKSFFVLRRDTLQSSSTTDISLPISETYSDFRTVDGVLIPFKVVQNSLSNGTAVITVKDVKFDVEIPAAVFQPKAKK